MRFPPLQMLDLPEAVIFPEDMIAPRAEILAWRVSETRLGAMWWSGYAPDRRGLTIWVCDFQRPVSVDAVINTDYNTSWKDRTFEGHAESQLEAACIAQELVRNGGVTPGGNDVGA